MIKVKEDNQKGKVINVVDNIRYSGFLSVD